MLVSHVPNSWSESHHTHTHTLAYRMFGDTSLMSQVDSIVEMRVNILFAVRKDCWRFDFNFDEFVLGAASSLLHPWRTLGRRDSECLSKSEP